MRETGSNVLIFRIRVAMDYRRSAQTTSETFQTFVSLRSVRGSREEGANKLSRADPIESAV
jgi:hypothetical protein